MVKMECNQVRAKVQCAGARREVVRDLMRYTSRRWCSHWTECVCVCVCVCVELCEYARCVESCCRDEFVRRVGAEGEEIGETCNGG
jgi:hypothetical protein